MIIHSDGINVLLETSMTSQEKCALQSIIALIKLTCLFLIMLHWRGMRFTQPKNGPLVEPCKVNFPIFLLSRLRTVTWGQSMLYPPHIFLTWASSVKVLTWYDCPSSFSGPNVKLAVIGETEAVAILHTFILHSLRTLLCNRGEWQITGQTSLCHAEYRTKDKSCPLILDGKPTKNPFRRHDWAVHWMRGVQ